MNRFIPSQSRRSRPSVLQASKFAPPRVEFSDFLGGPGSCGESPEPSARPKRSFFPSALASEVEFRCGLAARRIQEGITAVLAGRERAGPRQTLAMQSNRTLAGTR